MSNQKVQILIADDNREFGDILREFLDSQEDFNVVGIARDGIEAYDCIVSKNLTS